MPFTSFSPTQFVALNEEIAALVRAGVPLEQGLADVGREERGGLAWAAQQLSERLNRGESLPAAVESVGLQWPVAYRAVLAAGLASGSLPETLEAINRQATAAAELRRQLRLASVYPLAVIMLAWVLGGMILLLFIPRLESWYAGSPAPGNFGWFQAMRSSPALWIWTGPVLLVLAALLVDGWPGRWLFRRGTGGMLRFPGLRGPGLKFEWATFADLLALLLEHNVPAPDSLRLAADSCSVPELRQLASHTAERIEQGEPADPTVRPSGSRVPPALYGILRRGISTQREPARLRQLAGEWREQAARQAMLLVSLIVPGLAAVAAGLVVLLYALSVFLPLTRLWDDLMHYPL